MLSLDSGNVSPGFHAPAFVERASSTRPPTTSTRSVAGVHAPAFVERVPAAVNDRESLDVSPGFTPRPSLSGEVAPAHSPPALRVAGVHAPAFVERTSRRRWRLRGWPVSPGFTPRPSLSAPCSGHDPGGCRVSPGFTPRPSLSDRAAAMGRRGRGGVAGVHAPAFVERGPSYAALPPATGVAGVHAPAFVERPKPPLRPYRALPCRRGSRPGLR